MPTIKIDGKEYDLDTLPKDVRGQLTSLQFAEAELARLKAQVAVFTTARNAYSQALKSALDALPKKNAH